MKISAHVINAANRLSKDISALNEVEIQYDNGLVTFKECIYKQVETIESIEHDLGQIKEAIFGSDQTVVSVGTIKLYPEGVIKVVFPEHLKMDDQCYTTVPAAIQAIWLADPNACIRKVNGYGR